MLDLVGRRLLHRAGYGCGLWLQADGSIVLGTALYRTGGTTPPIALHPAWTDLRALLAGDRVFSGDLSMTSAQGMSRIVVPGLRGQASALARGLGR